MAAELLYAIKLRVSRSCRARSILLFRPSLFSCVRMC